MPVTNGFLLWRAIYLKGSPFWCVSVTGNSAGDSQQMCSLQFMNMEGTGIEQRFGRVVRKLRMSLGYSQEELAGRAGLHRTYVCDVEHGNRNVSLRSVEKLARALNVSTGVLFSESSDQSDGAVLRRPGRTSLHRGTSVD